VKKDAKFNKATINLCGVVAFMQEIVCHGTAMKRWCKNVKKNNIELFSTCLTSNVKWHGMA